MFDLNKRHHYFFDEIRKIPRGSGNEEGIAPSPHTNVVHDRS